VEKDFIAVMEAPGVVKLEPMEIKPLKPNQVRIEVKYCSICGSDLHIYKGKHPYAKLPVALGHELSGIINELGSEVKNLKIGQKVVVEPVYKCGICEACRRGNYCFCEQLSFQYRKGNGAMRKYFTIEEECVFPISEDISFDIASLIEPLAVAVHAVRKADVRMGETVLVMGCGAIGLLVTALCAKVGASKVIAADQIYSRLELAKELGATDTINTKEINIKEAVKSITGSGVDKSIECVGIESTFMACLECLNMGGVATVLGIFENPEVKLTAPLIVARELTIRGSQAYCWDFKTAIEMATKVDLGKLLTHKFPMSEIQKAMDIATDRKEGAIKVSLYPDW
jgi:(R,R)-butanediol dehydrogenase/meso-butanediol dehydrogenase/diacetyl reductase/L-iditol 2-dehydrogenase